MDTVDVTTALEKQAVDAEGPVLALFAASGRGSPFAAPAEQFARVSVRSFSLPGHMRGATLESEPQHTASIDEDVARESLSEVGRVGSLEAGHPLRIEHHYEKHALAGSATTEADASSNIVGYGNEGSASGTGSPFYSPRTSRATSPLRRVHSITLCTNGREADVKLLTHPSQALTQEEFADRGLDKELIDREKFRASSYAVEPVWDPTTNVTKRCAKPDIFRVDDGEVSMLLCVGGWSGGGA